MHRAGRLAQAGQVGHTLLFLLPSERQYVENLELRSLRDISPLSLSSTLSSAAVLCRGLMQEGELRALTGRYNDADGDNVDPDDRNGRPPRSSLCASFDRIREFLLSHALLFRNDGGEVDGGGATQDVVFPVLRAHPNLNPMGESRRRRRGQGGGGWWQQ